MAEYIPPENIHSPLIKKTMRPLAEAIQKESGATRVIIITTYELNGTVDKMGMKMSVSTDNVMERTDALPPKPTGDKLTSEAEQSIRNVLDRQPDKGDNHV